MTELEEKIVKFNNEFFLQLCGEHLAEVKEGKRNANLRKKRTNITKQTRLG